MNLQNLAALILIAAILTLMAHPPRPAATACRNEPAPRPIWDMRRLNANHEF